MAWIVKLDTHAIRQLRKLSKVMQRRITSFLQKHIQHSENPRISGKPLVGHMSGLWRYRVGDYRIVCKIKDDELTVLVINIGHRKNVYKH